MIGHDFPYLDTRDLNLDWLLKNMKQLLQDWATYQQNMNQSFADLEAAVNQFESDMTTAFNNLHDYVEDYFDNLDVQQEINNKLDDMRESGELIQIMQPVISTQTSSWLSQHITNPSNPPIDTSLTVSNAAADAKTVGDWLDFLKTSLYSSDDILYNGIYTVADDEIISGGAGTHGEPSSATTVIRAKNLYHIPKGSSFTLTPGTTCSKVMAAQYDLDRTFIKLIGSWSTSAITWRSDIDSLYVFMFMGDGTALSPSDYDGSIVVTVREHENVYNQLNQIIEKKKQNTVAYVSGEAIDWVKTGAVCDVTISGDVLIRTNTGISDPSIPVLKADILTAAAAYSGVTVSGDTISGNAFCIYYDFDTSSVKVSNTTDVNCFKNTCVLFINHWGSLTAGELVNNVMSKMVKANQANITSLDSRVTALEGTVPSYLESDVTSALSKLVEECDEKSFVIVFTTDNHYGASNGMNFPQTVETIQAINKKYPVDIIVNGGDLINGDELKAVDISRIEYAIGAMKDVNNLTYTILGNHDDGSFTASETPLLSAGELYALFARHMTVIMDNIDNEKVYGYKDFDSLNIRVIFLDSHINNGSGGATPTTWGYDLDQITWLENVALDTDKQVIIFSHMGVTQEFSGADLQPVNGVAVREVIEDFISNGGVVVGMFHGHTHWDFIGKYSATNGFYEISTGCGRVVSGPIPEGMYRPEGATMPTRQAETATQELYDIIVVKPLSRYVKMIRFGAGEDREFTY